MAEHGVFEDDTPGSAQVRQLLGTARPPPHPQPTVTARDGGRRSRVLSEPTQLEWVPPGVPADLAERYLCQLPPGRVPVRGTSGALLRQRSLQTQLPAQDLDVSRWQAQYGGPEVQRMRSYVQDVRQNAVGQGIVCEFPPDPAYQRNFVPTNTWGSLSPSGGGQWRGPTAPCQPLLQGGEPTYFASVVSGPPQQQQQQQYQHYQQQQQQYHPQQQQPQQQWQQQQQQRRHSAPQWGGPEPLDLPVSSRGAQPSDSFTADAESARLAGTSLHRSPSPSPRGPFRSAGGTTSGLCRTPVTVTGDQPFRGLQSVPTTPNDPARIVTPHRPRSTEPPPAGRTAATSSYDLGSGALPAVERGWPGGGGLGTLAAVAPAERPPPPAWDTRRRWCCHQCRAAMRPGDVAVFAERAGANKCWHPQCFVCTTCQELLVDLIYFYKSGQVFCGRHYAERLRLSRCPACDQLIFSHQYTEAGGRHWHTRHFCCAVCGQPLAGRQYVMREERPHCLDCYQEHYGKVCVTCSRPIAPSSQRVSLGDELFWHATAECFHCYTCRAGLVGASFICSSSKVFCSAACAQAF